MNVVSGYLKKAVQLINKDIPYEDESKQVCVTIRVFELVLLVNFVLFELASLIFWSGSWMLLAVPWIILSAGCLVGTYYLRTRTAFHLFSVVNLLWVAVTVWYFGWNVGVQHFLFPILLMSFFATYSNFRGKLVYTVLLFLMRLAMFLYTRTAQPVYPLGKDIETCFQIFNMLCIYTIMFYNCWTLSQTTKEVEEKLAFYNKRLHQEARTDALTGLWNRRSMMEYLESHIKAGSEEFFAVAIGDIDFFKKVNDTRGHNCGDEVLRQLGRLFSDYMNEKGVVCRWGGEEFFFVFPGNGDDCHFNIEQLRSKIQNMVITDPTTKEMFSVTMTFGVEEYDFSCSVTELIRRADDKLYIGKDQGRNRTIY